MPFENEAEAAAALFEAVKEDGDARSDPFAVETAGEEQAVETGADQGATTEDTFTRFDPNTLPEELLPVYKSLQADYTRKTQAVAEERKAFEQLEEWGGVDTAIEAISFANNLATDPNYALQVHGQLTQALTQAGLTPAQASQAAAEVVNDAAQGAQSDDFAFGDDEYDSKAVQALKKQLEQTQSQLGEFENWRNQQEQEAFNLRLANEMSRQESNIRQQNSDYTDKDLERIYTLSYAFGGNLEQANDVYTSMQGDILSNYIAKKGAVSSGVTGVTGVAQAGHEEAPKFDGLYDKRLEALVRERLAQELAE